MPPRPTTTTPSSMGHHGDFDKLNRAWKLKQVLLERGAIPIALGVVFGYHLCGMLNGFAGLYGALIYFPMVIVGMPLAIILSFLAGTILMRIWLGLTKATHAEQEAVDYCRNNGIDPHELLRPTWYSIYGTAIGLVAWSIMGSIVLGLTGQVILIFVAYPIAWLLAHSVNKRMFVRTQTNKLIIEAVRTGYFDHLFTTKDVKKRDAERNKVINSLSHRYHNTVRTTLRSVRVAGTLAKLSIIGAIIMLAISLLLFHWLNAEIKSNLQTAAADGVNRAVSNAQSNGSNSNDYAYEQEQKKRRDRQWKEDQMRRKQSVSDYERRRGHTGTSDAWAASANRDRRDAGL